MKGQTGTDLEAPGPDLVEHCRRQSTADAVALETALHLGVDEDLHPGPGPIRDESGQLVSDESFVPGPLRVVDHLDRRVGFWHRISHRRRCPRFTRSGHGGHEGRTEAQSKKRFPNAQRSRFASGGR